ncbi:MAG: hypothetical protein RQ751_00055 [Longimicrobiales bacterium]|nr:hypothetical protein [Longimicrobiales bacterium]
MTVPGPAAAAPPWIETRAGGLFFVNALLVAPALSALYPWSLRWLLRASGLVEGPSRILDPVPAVADHFIPVLGWLALPAVWLVWRNLRLVGPGWPRRLLLAFLVVHLGTLAYTVARLLA